MNIVYDLIVIGGGISSCTLISQIIKDGFKGRIAIIENGRSLGGRCSTRYKLNNKNWILNHGAPNFNICNKNKNPFLKNYIEFLVNSGLIKLDDSKFYKLNKNFKIVNIGINDFHEGIIFKSVGTMSSLSKKLLDSVNFENQIDFYFNTLITNLQFNNSYWLLSSKEKDFKCKFLVSSSNLLIHERSKKIFNVDQIPLRKAISENKNKKIDTLINLSKDQGYIQRINFLIYTNSDFKYKKSHNKDIHFFFDRDAENNSGFERVIFQKQINKKIGIVIHTKILNKGFNEYLDKNGLIIKENLIKNFNKIFLDNLEINQLLDYEDLSIMQWRASQPHKIRIPIDLQICSEYNIAFCGDWFNFEGYGRVEGAINSALNLSKNILNYI